MTSEFRKANARNAAEIQRLTQLIANLQFLNTHRPRGRRNNYNWMFHWENNHGNGLSEPNIERIQLANRARKANPGNYNIKKLTTIKDDIVTKKRIRYWMYGYVPKVGANWVVKGTRWVPPNLPVNEIESFYRAGKNRQLINARGQPMVLGRVPGANTWRTMFTKEGTLKPVVYTARRKPSPAKRSEPHLPTLKELAWKATPMATMTNEQLRFVSQMTPMNLTMLKPKKRAAPLPVNNLTKYRREAAASAIGKAAKKYLTKKPSQGPSPRSPATLARQANLRIMGGARRSPGAVNNTRITWSRNANGKIRIHKTLANIGISLSRAERNAISNMSENQVKNYIRNLARQR